jgi:REP element-mobilizing transposase RayT
MINNRVYQFDAIYHVTKKIINSEHQLLSIESRSLLSEAVEEGCDKYKTHLLAFCPMPNHIHMVIQPTSEDPAVLSRCCNWIFSNFTKRHNHMICRTGPFWNSRFFSRIIKDDFYLADAIRYVLNNPVRAGLVEIPSEYDYSTAWKLKFHIENNVPFPIFTILPLYFQEVVLSICTELNNEKGCCTVGHYTH